MTGGELKEKCFLLKVIVNASKDEDFEMNLSFYL